MAKFGEFTGKLSLFPVLWSLSSYEASGLELSAQKSSLANDVFHELRCVTVVLAMPVWCWCLTSAGFEHLEKPAAANALHNSGGVSDQLKYHHVAILDHLIIWAAALAYMYPIIWLHGPTGLGKSAIHERSPDHSMKDDYFSPVSFSSKQLQVKITPPSSLPLPIKLLSSSLPLIHTSSRPLQGTP